MKTFLNSFWVWMALNTPAWAMDVVSEIDNLNRKFETLEIYVSMLIGGVAVLAIACGAIFVMFIKGNK